MDVPQGEIRLPAFDAALATARIRGQPSPMKGRPRERAATVRQRNYSLRSKLQAGPSVASCEPPTDARTSTGLLGCRAAL